MSTRKVNLDGYLGEVMKDKFDVPEDMKEIGLNGRCVVCGGELHITEGDGLFVCLKCRRKENKDESSNNT